MRAPIWFLAPELKLVWTMFNVSDWKASATLFDYMDIYSQAGRFRCFCGNGEFVWLWRAP